LSINTAICIFVYFESVTNENDLILFSKDTNRTYVVYMKVLVFL